MTFAGLLKQHRVMARLTQQELAGLAGLGLNRVNELERGAARVPRKETVRLLADTLRLTGSAREEFEAAARGNVPADRRRTTAGMALVSRMLPRDIASFTGRAAELRRIDDVAAAGTGGIFTIGGMAGIGKTAFAVHAAHKIAGHFPDGQIFLSLQGHVPQHVPVRVTDALATLLQAIGIGPAAIPAGTDRRAALWRDRLASKKLLLVLDDATSSDQVRPLLPGSAGCLILVTSRRRLIALDAVDVIDLRTLLPEEAAELIVRLVARPGLEAEDPAVDKIAELSGYLPLAVGMLARQLRHHPAWTAAGLASELATVRDRPEWIHDENRTVAAAFDLSYADLTVAQRRLFRRLGLHPGTDLDAYAAAALGGTSLVAAGLDLETLYDQCLLIEFDPGRYRFHDLIREHARAQADADRAALRVAAVDRLLAYYLRTACAAGRYLTVHTPVTAPDLTAVPPALTPDLHTRAEAAAWMDAERLNLHAVALHAAEHGWPHVTIALSNVMHGHLRAHGHWEQAMVLHRLAVDLAQAGHDPQAEADALTNLGDLQCLVNDYRAAAITLSRAANIYRSLGSTLGEANALGYLGVTQTAICDYAPASASLIRALGLHQDLGDELGAANDHCNLGVVQLMTGKFEQAEHSLTPALRLYRRLGQESGEANVLCQLAGVQFMTGELQAAKASLDRALQLHRELGNRNGQANALYYLGAVQSADQSYSAAAASLGEALELYRGLGSLLGQAATLSELGALHTADRDFPVAADSLGLALNLYRNAGDLAGQAEVLNSLGALALARGRHDEARGCYEKALSVATDISSPQQRARALEGSGRCHLLAGERSEGAGRLREALDIYREIRSADAVRVAAALHELESQLSPGPPEFRG